MYSFRDMMLPKKRVSVQLPPFSPTKRALAFDDDRADFSQDHLRINCVQFSACVKSASSRYTGLNKKISDYIK